ncbi:universal stress protein [Rudanella lutea]|uniref:universal stress protein n=1 Tax=Rudanella lutea TaxID=451374 RepID=UPI0003670F9F|nr:universal stress protein [Rudanella lutea]
MKTILFPTDFSAQSQQALPIAAQLAKLFNARLDLVHVQSPPLATGWTPVPTLEAASANADMLTETIAAGFEQLKQLPCLQGVVVKTHLVEGTDVTEVLTQPTFAGAGLIVMSSSGAGGLKETLLGSNAERMIRHARIPVLVLKNPLHYLDLRSVVFASSFTDVYDASMNFIHELLDSYDFPQLHLLFVNTLGRFTASHDIQPRMEDFVKRYHLGVTSMTELNELEVEAGIMRFAQTHQADLVVLGTHGRQGLRHLLQGSIAEDVANHAGMAVLTLPLQTDPVPMVLF